MKKNKKYKVAIIGSGKIAIEVDNYSKITQPATHAGAFQLRPRTEIVGFSDIYKERLYKTQKYFPGIPVFLSTERMLKETRPDIVSIATYPNSHLGLIKLAIKNKVKGIVCEKPMADTLKDAKEIIKICRGGKVVLLINHMRRFDPLIREWQKEIKNGLIGDIVQSTCYYYNGLLNNGTHTIDLLRFFLGEIKWVRGIINKETTVSKRDQNIDGVVGFENGTRAFLQTLPKNYGFSSYYFYGTKGRFLIKNAGYKIELRKLIENKNYKNYYQLSEPIIQKGRLRSFMMPMANHIVACLDGEEEPLDTGEDGLAAIKIVSALRKSAKDNGKIVKLN